MISGDNGGQIIPEKWGDRGFGYDPIFIPCSRNITFGQIPNIQVSTRSDRRTNLIRMISALSQNDNELSREREERNYFQLERDKVPQ